MCLLAPWLLVVMPPPFLEEMQRNAAAGIVSMFGLGAAIIAAVNALIAIVMMLAYPATRRNGWLWFAVVIPVFNAAAWSAVGVP